MAKSRNKRIQQQEDDAEYYGRLPKKEETPKRQSKNWKKLLENIDEDDEDYFPQK